MKTFTYSCVIFASIAICFLMYGSSTMAQDASKQITARNGEMLTLNSKAFYVDPSLPSDDPAQYKFRTLHAAIAAAVDGTEEEPMVIYIEPDVYQMNGTLTDRGLYIDKDWVSLIGLSSDARDVVLADNRGHMIGAQSPSGSSPAETLFVTGTGFRAENLTIGNYCNVDLIYPMDPSKNQSKRSSTITQAYAIGAGNSEKTLDKFVFKNVRFISMLDTLALGSVERVYIEDSYIQGTDDFMGGGDIHVINNSTLHLYSGKPIYAAGRNGMAFIDSKWEVDFADKGDLTLAKNSSTLYLINNSFEDLNGTLNSIRWAPYPAGHVKSYASNITLDGKPYTILPEESGIDLNVEQLKAYSVYSLLKGSDGWDPAGDKEQYTAYSDLPVNITITEDASIRSGEQTAEWTAAVFPETASQHITWSLSSDKAAIVENRGNSVMIEGKNDGELPEEVIVTATAESGIFNQSVVTVYPSYVDPPAFTETPVLTDVKDGKISVEYALDLSYEGGTREDESLITWYRVDDQQGSNPIEVAVSRLNHPLASYQVKSGDIGHYIMVSIAPKHFRSHEGKAVTAISKKRISSENVWGEGTAKYNFSTDFENFSTSRQTELMDGIWTVDTYYPLDQYTDWKKDEEKSWEYTEGINGAADSQGLLTVGRGARLLYTQEEKFGDMAIHLEINPEKTAAQGFGSANGQYLEIYIKYDTQTKTGYALRIERTPKYSFATDFTLYEYVNGIGKPISESVSTTAFNPTSTMDVWVEDNMLHAKAASTSEQSTDQKNAELPNEVSLSASIEGNPFGGMGIQHTGTVSDGNRTQLKSLSIRYESVQEAVQEDFVYVVKPGDSLSKIAAQLLGGPHDWVKIYEWNKDRINHPNVIYPGQKLVIKK
ncbi:LysM peptidoglycan-binding domain-containing protein [Marinicrinis lubricantis]|uniref:LysM peptidoglycan-binding domain-containing protein n=1 Tax=Marinicrinis lubricantis TaxID=2086470 RepID=A0ABW1ITP8_9BACL